MALTIKRAERLVPVCLDGGLSAQWEQVGHDLARLSDELASLSKAESSTIKDDRMNRSKSAAESRKEEVAARVNELVERASAVSQAYQEATVTFRLRALPRADWEALVDKFPPADGADHELPFEPMPITDAALAVDGVIVSVTGHDGTDHEFTGQDWPEFSAELSESQHVEFRNAVIRLNAGTNDVPFVNASDVMGGSEKN